MFEGNSSLKAEVCPDGAQTFFNEKVGESYHSRVGPLTEAKHKFIAPLDIDSLLEKEKIKVLDPFFGFGYNTGTLIATLKERAEVLSKIEIIAIEKDESVLKRINDLQVPNWYLPWRDLVATLPYESNCQDIQCTFYMSDIFTIIDKLPRSYFDVILFDPFSYKTMPEFWEESFLEKIFSLLLQGGTLTTYSGLKRVENLALNLGYKTKRVTPLGRRKHSLCVSR